MRPPPRPVLVVLGWLLPAAALATQITSDGFRADASRMSASELAEVTRAMGPADRLVLRGLRLVVEDDEVTLVLLRAEVLSSGFRLFVDGQEREVPQSIRNLVFLRGEVAEWPGSTAVLTFDPGSGDWQGAIVGDGGAFTLQRPGRALEQPFAALALLAPAPAEDDELRSLESDAVVVRQSRRSAVGLATPRPPGSGVLYEAAIAFESDYEFFSVFGNETAAVAFIGALLSMTSTVYERQVDVILRVASISLYTTPADPWEAADPLCEFANWWQRERPVASYPRAAALFLSGRTDDRLSSKAMLATLCSSGDIDPTCSGGSYGQVLARSLSYQPTRAIITAHELGHIFGSEHTHCYDPPIDMCASVGRGCYSGPESEPPDGGSIMSYCPFPIDKPWTSLGEPGRYGFQSERVPQLIRAFAEQVAPGCLSIAEPFGLTASVRGSTVKLAWRDTLTGERAWLVEQSIGAGTFRQIRTLRPNSTAVEVRGLQSGLTYRFRVRARLARGFSPYSAVVEVAIP